VLIGGNCCLFSASSDENVSYVFVVSNGSGAGFVR
jgi:hypothetical protein